MSTISSARLLQSTFAGSGRKAFASRGPMSSQCLTPLRLRAIPRQPAAPAGFHSSAVRSFKTVEEAKSRYRSGPFSWKAGLLFLLSGVGLTFYFRTEKERMERKRIAEMSKGVGKPKVGGPLNLVDHEGKERKDEDWRGKFMLVYFGFTRCPDICPEELDKMAEMIDLVKKSKGNVMTPIFITCDPARDTPPVMKEYLAEFHPDIVGLTGTYDQIKQTCKSYRVYFSTPPDIKPGQDYLVDHSIYFYLMDPEGDFVEALGRQHTPEQAAKLISKHIGDWEGPLKK
ncbi:uncharacterized protein LAJ45_01577 [Morchella importuna]|uniref:SCO1 protein n=1 Tax=Morchella conica CCBAS932 TaxID=1392247 RepID=A0A3N4KVM1_9PEZI|nr:uncharacterized protein LAJ45_01577 [Morchella importuna]KAH8153810.1 hypothetical protein LAJ45_01577 [Morchella importuna]RPB13469.1 SCO1 protein [Morchella conica CCBAS932]